MFKVNVKKIKRRTPRIRERYECGFLVSIASIHPLNAKAFFAVRGKQLRAMGKEIHAALKILLETVGEEAHMDGAYDKIIYKMLCRNYPLRLLPPYASPDDATFERFVNALRRKIPAWYYQPRNHLYYLPS